MFKTRKKKITEASKRVARGTFILSTMKKDEFKRLYKIMEQKKADNPCKYKIPDWFTIKLIPINQKEHAFIGSFVEGDEYPVVYKDIFLDELSQYKTKIEQLDENTYKIIRKGIE